VVADDVTPLGVCITAIPITKRGERVLRIVALGGHARERWLPALHDRMRRYRREEGCAAIIACGRKGWGRIFGVAPQERNPDDTWTYRVDA
jgi:hypothetical protein